MKAYASIVIVSLALLPACASREPALPTGLSATEAESRLGSAAYLLSRCPVSDAQEAAPLVLAAVALAPLIADFVITGVGGLLKQEQEGLTGEFVAGTATTDLYGEHDGLSFRCLVIARGLFGPTAPRGSEPANGLDVEALKSLSLADYPVFYLEAEATLAGRSLLLQPKYVRYAQSSASNAGSGRKHVGVMVALSEQMLTPDDDLPADDHALAVFRFDLGRLEIGKTYRDSIDRPLLTGTASQQTLSSQSGTALPANVLAYVVESEEPGIVFRAFSTAFESQSANLKKAVGDLLVGLLPTTEEDD